jgi:hypothetical protein
VRIVGSTGTPIPAAQLFLARDASALQQFEPGEGFILPAKTDRLHLRVRLLGYGQLDTMIIADSVRGRQIDVQLLGTISTVPMVLVERVPWWKFWVR